MEYPDHSRPSLPPISTVPNVRPLHLNSQAPPPYSLLSMPRSSHSPYGPPTGSRSMPQQSSNVSIPPISALPFPPPNGASQPPWRSSYQSPPGQQNPYRHLDDISTPATRMSNAPSLPLLPFVQASQNQYDPNPRPLHDFSYPYQETSWANNHIPPTPINQNQNQSQNSPDAPRPSSLRNGYGGRGRQDPYTMGAGPFLARVVPNQFGSERTTSSDVSPHHPVSPFFSFLSFTGHADDGNLHVRRSGGGATPRDFPSAAPDAGGRQSRPPPASNRRSFESYSVDIGGTSTSSHNEEAAARVPPSHRVRSHVVRPRGRYGRVARQSFDTNAATSHQIDDFKTKLPRTVLSKLPKGTSHDCDICSKPYAEKIVPPTEEDEVAVELPCGHFFGEFCISQWIDTCKTYKNKITCPMCRKLLIEPSSNRQQFALLHAMARRGHSTADLEQDIEHLSQHGLNRASTEHFALMFGSDAAWAFRDEMEDMAW